MLFGNFANKGDGMVSYVLWQTEIHAEALITIIWCLQLLDKQLIPISRWGLTNSTGEMTSTLSSGGANCPFCSVVPPSQYCKSVWNAKSGCSLKVRKLSLLDYILLICGLFCAAVVEINCVCLTVPQMTFLWDVTVLRRVRYRCESLTLVMPIINSGYAKESLVWEK